MIERVLVLLEVYRHRVDQINSIEVVHVHSAGFLGWRAHLAAQTFLLSWFLMLKIVLGFRKVCKKLFRRTYFGDFESQIKLAVYALPLDTEWRWL